MFPRLPLLRWSPLAMLVVWAAVGDLPAARAAEETPPAAEKPRADFDLRRLDAVVAKGVDFLLHKGQASDGTYSKQAGTGVTAIAATALLRSGISPADPAVGKTLAWLEKVAGPTGGICLPDSMYANYETSIGIMCFAEANRDGKYDKLIQRAEAFVKGIQHDETEGLEQSDLAYGGAGYGRHKRPDLSNTSFLVDALKAAGAGPDDPAMQKALIFISRCQNLETEHNQTPFASKNPDGGFYYTIAAGGQSQAGDSPTGGLRSYGSMTYAGLKSMIHAGVDADDPRVKAAKQWIRKHYDLSSNPGMDQQGLYYYYHAFAKALDASGIDEFEDAKGVKHDWRSELAQALAERQQPDGSWVNPADRWMESDPNLVTSYALLALSYCRPK